MLTIAFFSTVLNHHQIEFCDTMYKLHGDGFTFVSTNEIEQQRIDLGYKLFERPYNLKMFENDDSQKKGRELFLTADVVILGVVLKEWLKERLTKGKITFLHNERIFKDKPSIYTKIKTQLSFVKWYYPFRKSRFYLLAASAYAPADFNSLGVFRGKCYQWGYFPPNITYENDQIIKFKNNEVTNLFWAGRLLEWKHPEYALYVAKELKERGMSFHLDIAGNGPLEKKLKEYIINHGLSNEVSMLGSMPPENIRKIMEKTNIYLFTSDRHEGFGAVLTEAMNSACTVVASNTAGATNFLVNSKVNGLIYTNDSAFELIDSVVYLMRERELSLKMGISAYETIRDMQNAAVAAERFSKVIESMISSKTPPYYPSGPMSNCYKKNKMD